MGSEEVLENSTLMDVSMSSCNGTMVQHTNGIEESENLGADLLKDFDLCWEDIEDRLTVSRMVSDSVIKGMVSAVEQEAVQKIAQKELELTRLKEELHLYHVGADENESVCSGMCQEQKYRKNGLYSTHSDTFVEQAMLQESLENLKIAVKGKLKKLKKEIHKVKGSCSMRRNSASEIVGLSGILPEKVPDKWSDVDRMLEDLGTTLDSFYKHTDDMVRFSKLSLFEWQQEKEFQAEIEGLVIQNCIRGLQEEFEQSLWDQNTQFFGNVSASWLEKVKELSSLRQELDAIAKSLFVSESGLLISHGSFEHRKSSGHHVSNGNHDESIITMPENLEAAQLKHMNREELFHYLKTEMTKMKRHHESKVQEMTEEIFSLKREYLKERGSSLPVRKDKDLDILRKKIAEVILKLDDILVENEKVPSASNNAESLDNMKDRLESLRLENHELRDLLAQKIREIKLLSSQVSDATEKMSQHSLTEVNLLRIITNLKSLIEDTHAETTISEDLHKILLKEFMGQIKCFTKESDLEYDFMEGIYEIIFREAAQNAKSASKLEIEDSDMESIITQGLLEVGLQEAFKEAEEKLGSLNQKYVDENKVRLTLEMEAMEKEKALRMSIAEKEKLDQDIHLLTATIQEKDKLVRESTDALEKEKENLELASRELGNLRAQTSQQRLLISQNSEESEIIKHDLLEALDKNKLCEEEISKLQEKIQLVTENLREATEEKSMLLAVSQEKQSLVEAREREHREQLDSIVVLVNGLSRAVTDFESRATKEIKRSSLRLENLSSQSGSLIQKAGILTRMGFLHKQKLESRCSDLQKAEAEVDLLGDEVENLLSLLEKIYIALDHYSPILKHYSGITEILKLVRRELNGESMKPV
ncbi:hypothetical protein POPTR_011G164400v4 [Populus trichocarpa]|uniref:Uncharacterized protein n=1 Tax=Populus trichocarpa TaxID=3694 RepID=A0ACC0SAH1_POPTR|nr:WPP domain-associated protein [Populus trichocarpa]KAI5572158.1 hypothetical protein BDE02_11G143800 [Populus trichocarpa]KAI5572159.1 hypothetical protein BDE02_11G143800 [Populus trichocarpa]KAI5572160.1 hypothetical protein BDE02_11G143800 [Populus trichocarpa]KAI9386197.1 hypothetical protein POPTR_011G164400v4 [Populus trichocarpa]